MILLIVFAFCSCQTDNVEKEIQKTYFPDGTLESEITMVKGVKNGTFTYYWESGLKEREGAFVNDRIDGTIVFYSTNGIDTNRVHRYEKGNSVLTKEYENGKLKILIDRVKGKIIVYDSNGDLISKKDIE